MKRFFGFFFAAMLVVCSCENMDELTDAGKPGAGAYDDTAIKDMINGLKGRLETLEQNVADIQAMLEGTVQIKSAVEADGTWTITLSNNSVITVAPQAEAVQLPANLITVLPEDGVNYWAMYVDGVAQPVLDAAGAKIPVVAEKEETVAPQFKNEEGVISVSFDGGNTWNVTGYEQPEIEGCDCEAPLFAGVEVVTKEMYGAEVPVYGIFTLVDGYEFTVTFDTWATREFEFSNPSVYFAYGVTSGEYNSPALYASEEVEYILEAPKGWIAELAEGESGDEYIKIVAPTREAVESGEAVASGYVKAIGALTGGKAVSAKMEVTTQYMTQININSIEGTIYTEYHRTCQDYLFAGVAPADEFDAETYAAELKGMMEGTSNGPMYGAMMLQQFANMEVSLAALYPMEIPTGAPMVFWVLPVVEEYDRTTYEYFYTCDANNVTVKDFALTSLSIEPTAIAWNKIDIKAEISGLGKFYYGVSESQYFNFDEFVEYDLPHISRQDYAEMPISFEGSISEFPGDEFHTDILPGKEYVLWIVLEKNNADYTADDVLLFKFATDALVQDGTLKPIVSNVVTDFTSIKVDVEMPEGGQMMYYGWMDTLEDLPAYEINNNLMAKWLIENGNISVDSKVTANMTDLQSGVQKSLLALVIDENGAYGEVVVEKCKTNEVVFNPATVTLSMQPSTPMASDTVKISVSVSDTTNIANYLYYSGDVSDYYWYNSKFGLGASLPSAQMYFATQRNSATGKRVVKNLAYSEDAVITVPNVITTKEYVVVVAALYKDGAISEAAMVSFKPILNLGNFTSKDSAAWTESCPSVTIGDVEQLADWSMFPYTVTLKEGYTGYALSAHKDFAMYEDVTTPEELAAYLIANGTKFTGTLEGYEPNGSAGYGVFVTWCDASGNYFEPYFHDANITGGGFGVL